MGTKKNHQKTAKKVCLFKKVKSGSRKKLIISINSVLEDILIYHLRLKENFIFFFEKKSFKKLQVLTLYKNFVGSDPRLLEIGAKWRNIKQILFFFLKKKFQKITNVKLKDQKK